MHGHTPLFAVWETTTKIKQNKGAALDKVSAECLSLDRGWKPVPAPDAEVFSSSSRGTVKGHKRSNLIIAVLQLCNTTWQCDPGAGLFAEG